MGAARTTCPFVIQTTRWFGYIVRIVMPRLKNVHIVSFACVQNVAKSMTETWATRIFWKVIDALRKAHGLSKQGCIITPVDWVQRLEKQRNEAEDEVWKLHCEQRAGMIRGRGCWAWIGHPEEDGKPYLHKDACDICRRVFIRMKENNENI